MRGVAVINNVRIHKLEGCWSIIVSLRASFIEGGFTGDSENIVTNFSNHLPSHMEN